jgi:hypothetical protein
MYFADARTDIHLFWRSWIHANFGLSSINLMSLQELEWWQHLGPSSFYNTRINGEGTIISYYIILYYIIFRVYTTSEDLINVSINKQKEERNPPHSFDNEINLIYGIIS